MEETTLIRLAQSGDDKALAELLRLHYAFVRNYLVKWTMNPELAQEVTQETMMRAVTRIGLYNGTSKFSSWLITIASRIYLDLCRKSKRERLGQEQYMQSLRRMRWSTQSAGGEWSELLEAMAALEPEMQAAVLLKHYYGYGYEEIGQMLGIPAGTVKSRVHHGVRKLREEWESDDEGAR